MNAMIDQLAHGGAFILAAVGFLIFFITQIWKAVHVEESYGEKLASVKQPKSEWLLLVFILVVGIVVVIRLFMEYQTPTGNMPDSYQPMLIGAGILVIGLLIFLTIRTVSQTKFFTNGILVHDYGYVAWEDIKAVDKMPNGQYQMYLIKPRPFKGKSFFIRHDAAQDEELKAIIQEYVR
ncbi:MAG: hypothetical protein EOM34_03120 [Clostridia bacterium]|nr:hypothetical protein [Lachnospiraceae bacterium]NCB99654.1 hypothetical protein [Clostridia bacterium]NCD04062.1 hypothetical protein [Clostridia bacterium]